MQALRLETAHPENLGRLLFHPVSGREEGGVERTGGQVGRHTEPVHDDPIVEARLGPASRGVVKSAGAARRYARSSSTEPEPPASAFSLR